MTTDKCHAAAEPLIRQTEIGTRESALCPPIVAALDSNKVQFSGASGDCATGPRARGGRLIDELVFLGTSTASHLPMQLTL